MRAACGDPSSCELLRRAWEEMQALDAKLKESNGALRDERKKTRNLERDIDDMRDQRDSAIDFMMEQGRKGR